VFTGFSACRLRGIRTFEVGPVLRVGHPPRSDDVCPPPYSNVTPTPDPIAKRNFRLGVLNGAT